MRLIDYAEDMAKNGLVIKWTRGGFTVSLEPNGAAAVLGYVRNIKHHMHRLNNTTH